MNNKIRENSQSVYVIKRIVPIHVERIAPKIKDITSY